MPVGWVVAPTEYHAAEVEIHAMTLVQLKQYRVVHMQIRWHLESGPHVVAADDATIEHLVGMEQRWHQIVDGVPVQECAGIHALALALPHQHYTGQIGIDVVGGEFLGSVRHFAHGSSGQVVADPKSAGSDGPVVLGGRLAFYQAVADDQIERVRERTELGNRTHHVDDRIARVEQTAAGSGALPGQRGAFHNSQTLQDVGYAFSRRFRIAHASGIRCANPRAFHFDHGLHCVEDMHDPSVLARRDDIEVYLCNSLSGRIGHTLEFVAVYIEHSVCELCGGRPDYIPYAEILSR